MHKPCTLRRIHWQLCQMTENICSTAIAMHLKIYDTHKITVLCVCGQLFNIWGQTGKMWLWRLTWVERVCVRGLWGWPCPGRSGGQPVNPRLKTQTTRLVNKLGYIPLQVLPLPTEVPLYGITVYGNHISRKRTLRKGANHGISLNGMSKVRNLT